LDTPVTLASRTYQASNPISEAVVSRLAGGASSISVGDLFHALLDPIDPGAPAGNLATLPHVRVLAEIARPLLSSLGPLISAAATPPAGGGAPGTPGTPGGGTPGTPSSGAPGAPGGNAPTATSDATVASMRAELDALKATVTTQQATLDSLRKRPPAAK